ncbi:MAG TPA: hypothetical protein VFX59_08350 [Polyangiales bacterium]|nr:hypothetical protein [Polyangiales bacterium]
MTEPETLSDLVADPLVMGVIHGDRAAWFQLTLWIERWVEQHAPRHWRMRRARLHGSRDDIRDVFLATLERLDRDEFTSLRRYAAQKREALPTLRAERDAVSFVAWLGTEVDFAIREHVRQRYGRVSSQPGDEPWTFRAPSKRSLHSWAARPSETPPGVSAGMTQLLTARSILDYAREVFAARELALLQRYLEQATFEELAEEFTLASPELARAEIRKLKERLRARFRQ